MCLLALLAQSGFAWGNTLFYILLVMFFWVTSGLVINNYPPLALLLHCSGFSASPCFVCPSSAHAWVLFMLSSDKWLYYQSFIWCFLYQFALYFLFSCLPCWPSPEVFYICFSFVPIQFSLLQGWHMNNETNNFLLTTYSSFKDKTVFDKYCCATTNHNLLWFSPLTPGIMRTCLNDTKWEKYHQPL